MDAHTPIVDDSDNTLLSLLFDFMKIIDAIDEFLQYFGNSEKAVSTKKYYRVNLNIFQKFLLENKNKQLISEVGVQDCLVFASRIRLREYGGKPISSGTVNIYLQVIRRFMEYCDALEYCSCKAKIIKGPKKKLNKIPSISKKTLDFLFSAPLYKRSKACMHRDMLLFGLGYFCGLRVSEALALTFDDLKTEKLIIKGKGGKTRIIPLREELKKTAYFLKLSRKDDNPLLFTSFGRSNYGTPLTAKGVNWLIKEYLDYEGITERVTYHMFRHTFATELANKGVSPRVVMDLMGHSNIETTLRYYDSTPFSMMFDATALLGDFAKKEDNFSAKESQNIPEDCISSGFLKKSLYTPLFNK